MASREPTLLNLLIGKVQDVYGIIYTKDKIKRLTVFNFIPV